MSIEKEKQFRNSEIYQLSIGNKSNTFAFTVFPCFSRNLFLSFNGFRTKEKPRG